MANRFFNPESGVWQAFGYVGEIVMLSLIWAVCCLPVFTIGAATTALYDSVVHVLRRRDSELFLRYFGTFKRELKSGALSTLLWAGICAVFYGIYRLLASRSAAGPVYKTGLTLYSLLVPFFLLCVLCWVFPLLSRFTFDTLSLNRTALRLSLGHILRSVLLSLLTIAAFLACYLLISPIMFVPGLAACLSSFLIEPVFRKYEEKDDGGTSPCQKEKDDGGRVPLSERTDNEEAKPN